MKELFKKWLEKLACKHEWVEIKKLLVWGDSNKYPKYYIYVFVCSKCGKFKKVKL